MQGNHVVHADRSLGYISGHAIHTIQPLEFNFVSRHYLEREFLKQQSFDFVFIISHRNVGLNVV